MILTLAKSVSDENNRFKRVNVKKIISLKDLINVPIKNASFKLNSLKDLDELSKFLIDPGNCFKACGCKGWGWIDIIIDDMGIPWVIELNTVPGMTSHSLVPLAAKQRDINFENLVLKILDSSL